MVNHTYTERQMSFSIKFPGTPETQSERTGDHLTHGNETRRSREMESLRNTTCKAEQVCHETVRGGLKGELFAATPEVAGAVHRADHVLNEKEMQR